MMTTSFYFADEIENLGLAKHGGGFNLVEKQVYILQD